MKKMYISGKITGLPQRQVAKKFAESCQTAKRLGYEPVSPPAFVPEAVTDWNAAMRICIAYLVGCDAILLQEDWPLSRGAKIEHDIARALNYEIKEEWKLWQKQ